MKKVILTTLALALTGFAFWPAGGVKVVQTPEIVQNPQMIYLNDGSVIISWHEQQGVLTAGHTYCQKLDTTGNILWDSSGIRVCLHDSLVRDHHMVTDGQNVWFVWQDERADDGDIYAQKISGSTGQRLWGDSGKVVCMREGGQREPKCTLLESGALGVTFQDCSYEPYTVSAQYIQPDGSLVWDSSGQVTDRSLKAGWFPEVVASGEDFIVCWGGRDATDEKVIRCQKFNQAGDYLFDTLGLLVEYHSHFEGGCSDNYGGAIVLYNRPETFDLAVQRIDSSGQVLWPSGGVTLYERSSVNRHFSQAPFPPYMDWANLITDSSGGCFVYWEWDGLHAQHVDSGGNLVWNSEGIQFYKEKSEEENKTATRLCSDGNGGIFAVFDNLVWGGMYEPPEDFEFGIFVQRIGADGTMIFGEDGIIVRRWVWDDWESLPPLSDYSIAVTAIPSGVMLSWVDDRHKPDNSLYAQIVDTTGKVGSGIEEEAPPISYPALEVISSINSGNVILKYSLSAEESGTLKLFEVTGRLVRTQRLDQPSGKINWNVQDLSSGVYFAELRAEGARVSRKVVVIREIY